MSKINGDGSFAWSSYLGGASEDQAYAVATDSSGNAWVTGYADSPEFASGEFDTSYNGGRDSFVAKISDDYPVVNAANHLYETTTNQLRFGFSRDVSGGLSAASLLVTPLPGGPPLAITGYSFDALWNIATFTLPTGLADGNYRAVLPSGTVIDADGISMQADYTFDFFILAADANRDRKVDVLDLVALANNWLGTGKTFSQGDFNYDGVVDQRDLGILATHWQQELAPPPLPSAPGPTAARRPAARTPTRIIQIITDPTPPIGG